MQTFESCDEVAEFNSEDVREAVHILDVPSYEWLQQNFKSKAAATRYLVKEFNLQTKDIAGVLRIPYRQVFGTILRMKRDAENIKDHTCPVCRRLL